MGKGTALQPVALEAVLMTQITFMRERLDQAAAMRGVGRLNRVALVFRRPRPVDEPTELAEVA